MAVELVVDWLDVTGGRLGKFEVMSFNHVLWPLAAWEHGVAWRDGSPKDAVLGSRQVHWHHRLASAHRKSPRPRLDPGRYA